MWNLDQRFCKKTGNLEFRKGVRQLGIIARVRGATHVTLRRWSRSSDRTHARDRRSLHSTPLVKMCPHIFHTT